MAFPRVSAVSGVPFQSSLAAFADDNAVQVDLPGPSQVVHVAAKTATMLISFDNVNWFPVVLNSPAVFRVRVRTLWLKRQPAVAAGYDLLVSHEGPNAL